MSLDEVHELSQAYVHHALSSSSPPTTPVKPPPQPPGAAKARPPKAAVAGAGSGKDGQATRSKRTMGGGAWPLGLGAALLLVAVALVLSGASSDDRSLPAAASKPALRRLTSAVSTAATRSGTAVSTAAARSGTAVATIKTRSRNAVATIAAHSGSAISTGVARVGTEIQQRLPHSPRALVAVAGTAVATIVAPRAALTLARLLKGAAARGAARSTAGAAVGTRAPIGATAQYLISSAMGGAVSSLVGRIGQAPRALPAVTAKAARTAALSAARKAPEFVVKWTAPSGATKGLNVRLPLRF